MKTDLSHLPAWKQRELDHIVKVLFQEFDDALKLAQSSKRKAGRIVMIVLYGSHARGDWVFDRVSGYKSDFDILVVVNQQELTDEVDYWPKAQDRFQFLKTPVQMIVETYDDVQNHLARGQYFFADIQRDGIALYRMRGKTLREPGILTAEDALDVAQEHYDIWMPSAREFYDDYVGNLEKGRFNKSAFELHQAVERAYACMLLVYKNYRPQTHNIEFLRGQCEQLTPHPTPALPGPPSTPRGEGESKTRLGGPPLPSRERDGVRGLIDIWPRYYRRHKRLFQLLKSAYIEARYSKHYKITRQELEWLGARVEPLLDLVDEACKEKLAKLKSAI